MTIYACHPDHGAADAVDPDCNNIEAIFHRPIRRSEMPIVVAAEPPS